MRASLITKLTTSQMANIFELREMGEKWHHIAWRLNVSEAYLQRCVRQAKELGFAAFRTTDTNAVKGVTRDQHG